MPQNRVAAIERYLFDAADLTGGFDQFIESLDEACSIIRVVNTSNSDISISYDGTHYNDYVPAGETLQLEFQTNNRPQSHIALMAKGQRVYLVGGAGQGYIYFIGYYSTI